jgi:heat shock protein HtpX
MQNLYTHQDANVRRTWLLMATFFIFVIAGGWLFAAVRNQPFILYGAVIVSVVMNVVSYWFSDKIALSMSGARLLTHQADQRIYHIVENLCITAGLPLPRIFVIPGGQINAFATGRDPKHAAMAFTQGALEKLNDNELAGVAAHELSHIGNRDILISTVAVVLAGVVAIMADWFLRIGSWGGNDDDRRNSGVLVAVSLLAAILAPIAATMIQLAVSRKREYVADTSAALLTRYPEGLASALEKIAVDTMPLKTANNSTAHLFIANPFKQGGWVSGLFQTHPPIQRRISILRGLQM